MTKKVEVRMEVQKPLDYLDLKAVTQYAGFAHDIYTRQLLRQGKFDSPIPPVKEEHKGYWKWMIAKASVDHYLTSRKVRTGMRRFILKMDLEAEHAARTALEAAGITFELALSFKPKAKDTK